MSQPKICCCWPSFKLQLLEEVEDGIPTNEVVQNFNVSRSNIIKWVKNNEKLIDVAKCKYKNHLNIRHPTKYVNLYRVLQKSLMNAEQRLSYKFRLVMVSWRKNISRTTWWWIFKWGRSDDQKNCPKNINKQKCKNDNHIEEKTYQNRKKMFIMESGTNFPQKAD